MSERLVCLDANVIVKYLVEEEGTDAADRLIRSSLSTGDVLAAPGWSWAEVGSVLRSKRRRELITQAEADRAWTLYGGLPIEFVESGAIRERAWRIAADLRMPTLYDAAYLACTELAPGPDLREFWTADRELLRQLGRKRPAYVRELRA